MNEIEARTVEDGTDNFEADKNSENSKQETLSPFSALLMVVVTAAAAVGSKLSPQIAC